VKRAAPGYSAAPAVRPFYNTINDLKNRLRMLRERGGSLAELPRPPAY
jgi:hypothetical protein